MTAHDGAVGAENKENEPVVQANQNDKTSDKASDKSSDSHRSLGRTAIDFAKQSEKLSHQNPVDGEEDDVALEAKFVTDHDPVIITTNGHRLPGVPLKEAHKLNLLKEEMEDGVPTGPQEDTGDESSPSPDEKSKLFNVPSHRNGKSLQKSAEGSLRRQMPPSHTK